MNDRNTTLMTAPDKNRTGELRQTSHQVRRARADDCAAIAETYNQAIRARRSTMDTQPTSAGRYLDLLHALTLREVLVVATPAGQDDQVCGWGIVKRYSDRPGYHVACETSVYVHERHQGQGFGAAIQAELLRHARALGYRHVAAKILATNIASIAFHRRFGFEDAGLQRRIGLIDGVWHDVAIMQHLIEPDAGA
jgi:phosphinothricin acetyltransferase